MYFKIIVLYRPLGKTKYYAIRVEFEVRGSPHVQSKGFAFYYSKRNLVMNHKSFGSISIVKAKKSKFSEHTVTLALTYSSPDTSVFAFINQLDYLINSSSIGILLGDFNTEVLKVH